MNVSIMANPIWSISDWCNFYGALNANNSLSLSVVEPEYSPPASSINLPLDTIGESARNRFGRPYISGRPSAGLRSKITIARTIGVTHSCVSKVIRRFEENGFIDNKGSRTASCACPGEADAHDPAVCRHVKFRNEQQQTGTELKSQVTSKPAPKPFSIDWILSDQCNSRKSNNTTPALNRLV
ncbi:Paired domain-containing protein [Aphelenchoides bicaudatus]|nr:Paired domain-containing protein [Aphelenchoides bicaudatus]